MPSVFDFLGLNSQSTFTSVPQLSINNPVHKLEIQSQTYFIINEHAKAADGNLLAVSIQKDQDFRLNNEAHLAHLRASITLFKEKSNALKAMDQKLVFSSLLGMVASTLSFIPFVSYFSTLGWGSALYYATQRNTAALEYQESLNLLVATCNWSLGQGPAERKSDKDALINNVDIREMMTALYPTLSERQVRHLIADDIEEAFAQELRAYENKYRLSSNPDSLFAGASKDEGIARSKRGAEFHRCVYGYQKGKATDYLDAFLSVFPDIYNALHHGFMRFQHWWNGAQPAAQETPLQAKP